MSVESKPVVLPGRMTGNNPFILVGRFTTMSNFGSGDFEITMEDGQAWRFQGEPDVTAREIGLRLLGGDEAELNKSWSLSSYLGSSRKLLNPAAISVLQFDGRRLKVFLYGGERLETISSFENYRNIVSLLCGKRAAEQIVPYQPKPDAGKAKTQEIMAKHQAMRKREADENYKDWERRHQARQAEKRFTWSQERTQYSPEEGEA